MELGRLLTVLRTRWMLPAGVALLAGVGGCETSGTCINPQPSLPNCGPLGVPTGGGSGGPHGSTNGGTSSGGGNSSTGGNPTGGGAPIVGGTGGSST
ncbi:MAG TPA: hypothetical protein VEX18_04755, partial [Polyangiaceae bacterium]|nr:hypothetical protein [Polyangiaceae bacterium]